MSIFSGDSGDIAGVNRLTAKWSLIQVGYLRNRWHTK